ncbi:PREDICTED: WAT1-related protein At5g13670-like [Camelina sativa]|uniref:WAT1-related protein n=1 Tax=Camelina sativa TaxID=90675 RepID=A0ABM0VAS4_CAMSA|nr:PREDICTED: WAT1-related protein At5g13670-like [Camelina sativa]
MKKVLCSIMKLKRAKPFIAIVFIQCLYALMSIVAKLALNAGMSPHVLVAYRMAVASVLITPFAFVLERNTRPRMTFKILLQIAILSLFEPVVEQNLYYSGMKLTTATFTSALCNALPAMTFIMACLFKLEEVTIKKRHSQAKLVGTMVAVGGAMLMTFVKGNVIELPWTNNSKGLNGHSDAMRIPKQDDIARGSIMLVASCFSWSCYIILQAKILAQYQAELSLTALMCIMGMLEATVLGLIWERKNMSVWKIKPDVTLLASIYGGLVSGLAYYVIGWASKERGPVFVSAFNPLSMVLVAILSTFIFLENMYLGRVVGSFVIVIGIYLVLWGKSKDKGGKLQPNAGCAETVVKIDEQKVPTPDNNRVVPTSDQIMIPTKATARSQESV